MFDPLFRSVFLVNHSSKIAYNNKSLISSECDTIAYLLIKLLYIISLASSDIMVSKSYTQEKK